MIKVQSTVFPPSRMQENTIKKGGLWYSDYSNELVKDAKSIISEEKKIRRYYVKEAAKAAKIAFKDVTFLMFLAAFVALAITVSVIIFNK